MVKVVLFLSFELSNREKIMDGYRRALVLNRSLSRPIESRLYE
jgi:hypothetical protein